MSHYYAFFTIAAYLYMCILYTVYYFKKKNKTVENKLFNILGLITLASIVIELFSDFGIPRLHLNGTIYATIIVRCYIYINMIWCFVICIYALYIALKGDDILKRFKKYTLFLAFLLVCACIFVSFFEVNYYISEEVNLLIYLYGTGVDLAFLLSLVFIALAFGLNFVFYRNLRINGGRISYRNTIPITFMFIWGIIATLIQIFVPSVTLISFSQVVIVTIIYFFLENPDLELLDQIDKAKTNADVANNEKTSFLSNMSHEIRTPLNAIVGLSENIKANSNISETVREDIADITAASNNLLEIIGNIIDINKIESDSLEINEVKYVFTDEFEPLIRVVSTRIGDKPIELRTNIDSNIPFELIGDKFHVKSVLNNLFTNAIKYTERGYINLNIKATDIVPNNSCVIVISVEDSGVGIKEENLSKLFSKFERLDFEGNNKVEGTGLGLSITKKVVEMMGGKIEVESVYGQGSKFTAYIPQKISKMECELTNTQRIDVNAINERINNDTYGGKKVLIVDDNKLNLKVAKKAIENFNFVIEEATNGEECLNKVISGGKYDLILMDIMMPIMDGETAMKELLKLPGFSTPVIAVTADAIAGAKEKYLADGFTDYVAKPFTKDQIKIKIDSVFRHENDNVDKVVFLSNNN